MKLLTIGMLVAVFSSAVLAAEEPVALKCDYRVTPLAVDRPNPLLSWRLDGERQGLAQTAYHIQAASSLAKLEIPDLWDSGWVQGAESTGTEYAGKSFASKQRVYWRVRIKDEKGAKQAWSEPSWFEGGLLMDGDWQNAKWISCTREIHEEAAPADVMGDWIGPEIDLKNPKKVIYTHQFALPDKLIVYAGTWWSRIENARPKLFVNGKPSLRFYNAESAIHYKDVAFNLKPGANDIKVQVEGKNGSAPICLGMHIVFADGSELFVRSSNDWNVVEGKQKNKARVVCAYGKKPLGEAIISPRAPLAAAWYKKDFKVVKPMAAARLYICGLGYNEPYMNGEKIGDHVLDPGQMDYPELAHYQVFDVQGQLKSGENTLAVLLGDGWYNNDRGFTDAKRFVYGKPGLRAYLDIWYEDGTSETIVTQKDWIWKESEIQLSNVFLGDRVDYRKTHDEWKKPGKSRGWSAVQEVAPLSPRLIAQDFPPIRVVREIDPVKTWPVGEKTWIVDLGENISGWIALDFKEPAGTVIRIRAMESVDTDGKRLVDSPSSFSSCHAAPQNHTIIADGKPHSWRPYFSYHGFRYAEISGLSKALVAGQIKGLVLHTDAPVTATFKSSEPMLDRMFKMGIQTHLNNMHSILEDCPHREKCLWGGDLHASWATGFYTLDSASFYRQQARLYFTPPFGSERIPANIGVGRRGAAGNVRALVWSVSPVFIVWRMYEVHGDLQPFEDHYDLLKHFLEFFENDAPGLIPKQAALADHAHPLGVKRAPEKKPMITTMHFYAAADRFAIMAEAAGKTADAKWSRDLAERIKAVLLSEFYDEEKQSFGNGTQDSLALAFGIVPESQIDGVARSLAKVYQKNGNKFDGGFMSYNIYPQLAEHGNVDLALKTLLNPDYPGLAMSIRDFDATTIYERFWGLEKYDVQMKVSHDHHAMNHPTAWMLNYLAGIQRHPDSVGYRRLLLQPRIPEHLEWVEAEQQTAYGRVKSAWKQDAGKVTWSFSIPANSVAEVRLPAGIKNLHAQGKKVTGRKRSFEFVAGCYELTWE